MPDSQGNSTNTIYCSIRCNPFFISTNTTILRYNLTFFECFFIFGFQISYLKQFCKKINMPFSRHEFQKIFCISSSNYEFVDFIHNIKVS